MGCPSHVHSLWRQTIIKRFVSINLIRAHIYGVKISRQNFSVVELKDLETGKFDEVVDHPFEIILFEKFAAVFILINFIFFRFLGRILWLLLFNQPRSWLV